MLQQVSFLMAVMSAKDVFSPVAVEIMITWAPYLQLGEGLYSCRRSS